MYSIKTKENYEIPLQPNVGFYVKIIKQLKIDVA